MKSRTLMCCSAMALFAALAVPVRLAAQEQKSQQNGNEPQTVVPARDNQSLVRRLVQVSGVLTGFAGKPLSGEVQVKFTLYKEETDEAPLWTETQKLGIDNRGRYTALLGATQTGGVPVELFGSDDARWRGVEVEGQPSGPRTLLVSVPGNKPGDHLPRISDSEWGFQWTVRGAKDFHWF